MTQYFRLISVFSLLVLVLFAPSGVAQRRLARAATLVLPAAPLVSGTMYGLDADSDRLVQINRADGTIVSSVALVLNVPGSIVIDGVAMATRPSDNVLFAAIDTIDGGVNINRRLVRVDPLTGACTAVGIFVGPSISTLAFRPSTGVLYGASDTAGTDPKTLFTIDQTTGVATVKFALPNGGDGDIIAFAPDGFLYHDAGAASNAFEKVNVDTQAVTTLSTAVVPGGEPFAMVYSTQPAAMYLAAGDAALYLVDLTDGSRTAIGAFDPATRIRGLAIVNQTTAANVTISGRVLDSRGGGVRGARVVITNSHGNTLTAMTNAFGYYTFASVPSGDTYIANATSRGMTFAPRVVPVNDAVAALDFSAR